MLFRWLRSRREALDLAKTLERENEELQSRLKAMQGYVTQVSALCRALRDVNADLDAKLMEVIPWGE
jgi:cell shape-determining protein MreC